MENESSLQIKDPAGKVETPVYDMYGERGEPTEAEKSNDSKLEKKTNPYYDVIREYSEYSTIAGLIYIFMRDQKLAGKLIWSLIVLSMVFLGLYWSVKSYQDWQNQPVLTTATTTGLPISSVEFPSIAICSQGTVNDVSVSALLKLYYEYRNVSDIFGNHPIDVAKLYAKHLDPNISLSDKMMIGKVYAYYVSQWQMFLNLSFPGLPQGTGFEYLVLMSMLQITSNPDSLLKQVTINNIKNATNMSNPNLDFWLNPPLRAVADQAFMGFKAAVQGAYSGLDLQKSTKAYLTSLWYATLPCYDISGITSNVDGETAMLKACTWKGIPISCAAIFRTFPTDQGMCCLFNMPDTNEMFVDSEYTRLLTKLQIEDDAFAFQNVTLPKWYVDDNEPSTEEGSNMGLSVLIDTHTDLLSPSTVYTDFEGFRVLVSSRNDFPLVQSKGFEIKPGHKNLVAMSAINLDADDGIRGIEPAKRNCLFLDETDQMKLHQKYSQTNCFLECRLFYAQNQIMQIYNRSTACTPWYLPFIDGAHYLCDPWELQEINRLMKNGVPESACATCLPDCRRVIYEHRISTQKFRTCDEKNLGTSELCSLEHAFSLPKPQIWATQVLNEYQNRNTTMPAFLSGIQSSLRSSDVQNSVQVRVFNNMTRIYEAYERDIALVNFYFDAPTVLQFGTQSRLGWIDFFSNVGGLLGLCLGLSIITFMEIIWVCLRVCRLAIILRNDEKAVGPPENPKAWLK